MSSSLCEALERPPQATHRRCNAERRNTPARLPRSGTLVPLGHDFESIFKRFYFRPLHFLSDLRDDVDARSF
jgi:hypothetical protein